MKRLICFLSILAVAISFSGISAAAEHPGEEQPKEEHPGKAVEHPGKTVEHPGKTVEHPGEAISASDVREAIEKYAKEDSELKGGYFFLYDPQDNKVLQLKFIRVHDRVSIIKKEGAHFACADFKTADGKTAYDLDFWMKKNPRGELEVYKIMVHKKDGNPRFTYSDDKIVPVKPAKMAPEEHT